MTEIIKEVPLSVGMIVSAVRRSGSFKIIQSKDVLWIDGRPDVLYFLRDEQSAEVLCALSTDLFVPGDLQSVANRAKYEIAVSKQPIEEEVYLNIRGEKELLKFLVHTCLEDLICLETEAKVLIKIRKEVKESE